MSDPVSEPTSDPAIKPGRALSRWRIGSLSLVQVVLLAVLLIAANYLASQYYLRKDLTRDESFSLSPATIRYLQSDAVRNRKDPIHWIVAFRASSAFTDRVRALSEEYERQSGGKIKLRLIDPVRNPDGAQKLAEQYGMYDPGNQQLARKDLVVIDARTQEQIEETESKKRQPANNVRIVNSDALITYEVKNQQRRAVGFQGEDLLTAALVASLEGQPRKFYLLVDKSAVNADAATSPLSTLQTTMALQNVLLVPLNMAGLSAIPDDASGVALVAPKYDFTPEEIKVLESYWNRKNSAILTLLKPDEVPPRLRSFLRSNGVTPQRDHVITSRNGQTISTVRASFNEGIGFTSDLARQATLFEGVTSSLEVQENLDDRLAARQVHPVSLITAAPDYWGEVKFGQGKETFDPREDRSGPLSIAAGVTRGVENDDRFASDSSRMLVMGTVDFLEPDRLMETNLDFIGSAVNWLVGREELAGIGAHDLGIYKMPLLDAQVSFINRVNLFFLPALALVIAGFVWSSRRA
jgi:hypothetical protein